ncbi:MAG: GAF domain-containing SpoIIE family protein phosphatase [Bacteroidota bacterium]
MAVRVVEQSVEPTLLRLEEENRRLRKAIEELSILNELGRVISSTMDSQAVMEMIVKRSVRAISAEQGAITLVEESSSSPFKTLIRAADSSHERAKLRIDQNIVGWMIIHKKPLLSNDVQNDQNLKMFRTSSAAPLKSLLCVPLLVKSKLIGILTLFNKKNDQKFTEDDQRLLAIIATQSGQVLETARLYEQEQAKLALEREVNAAREIQKSLLPKDIPRMPGIEVAAHSVPALEVGGDYYDFIPLGDGQVEMVLADVSGKGLGAALLAAMGKGVLYSEVTRTQLPKTVVAETNKIIRQYLQRKSFITLLLALIDTPGRTLIVCCAGHCPPIVYKESQHAAEWLRVRGAALNFMEDLQCEEARLTLETGDVYVFFSDGITEAANARGEFFGDERLKSLVEASHEQEAGEILNSILTAVSLFSTGAKQSDDQTVVVLKVKEVPIKPAA